MRDTFDFLDQGIPAVCICTEPFRGAAAIHAEQHGWPDVRPIIIPHPFGPLSEEAVHARADAIVAAVADALLKGTPGDDATGG